MAKLNVNPTVWSLPGLRADSKLPKEATSCLKTSRMNS